MAVTLTVKQHWTDGKRQHVVGTLAFSGSYVAGGMTLSLLVDGIFSASPIVHSDVVGKGGYYGATVGTLYEYRYIPQPSSLAANFPANGVIRIFNAGVELSAGALPAGVTSDDIFFYGIFRKY